METIKQFPVKGMHCASCANIITRTLKKVPGVSSVEVNYGTETAKISFDHDKTTPDHLSQTLSPLGYSLTMAAQEMNMSPDEHAMHLGLSQSKKDKLDELLNMKKKLMSVIPLAIFSVLMMGWDIFAELKWVPEMSLMWEEFFHHLLPLFATYTLFIVGLPYVQALYRFFRYGKANMDTLIGVGTITAFVYSFIISAFEETLRPYLNVTYSYYDVTIVVIAFITLGKYLEAKSKLRTGSAIEKLINLQAKTALVIREGKEVEVSIQEVKPGDIIVIKPGSKIPVDGVVVEGTSFVDESMISGEPIPVEKKKDDTVRAGTMNTSGSFTFSATKVGSETMLAAIIKMVQNAQGSKAPIQALADKISSVFVPVVLVLSFIALVVWLGVGTQYIGFSQALSYGLVSFVGILVIACPCALGLATPTAIIVGVGKGANEGILIKDAATLEKLHQVTTVVVDKTGTITKGKPELMSVHSDKCSKDEVVDILSALESKSEHPIAHAIVTYAQEKKLNRKVASSFDTLKGKGLRGVVDGIEYVAGNVTLMNELGIKIDVSLIETATKEGKTPIILATNKEMVGIVMVADSIKPEAKDSIQKLHSLGIKVVMLTGDNRNTAHFIAQQVGIDDVVAEVLPQDKMDKIKSLQSAGEKVAMTGDGINDAPALAQADVGIAMATGTDVAMESAGIILLNGDISKLYKAIRLSVFTMRGIKQNLFWAFIYNVIGIPIASGMLYPLFGWMLNPIFAGAAMAFSSVSVVLNSLRLKNKKL